MKEPNEGALHLQVGGVLDAGPPWLSIVFLADADGFRK